MREQVDVAAAQRPFEQTPHPLGRVKGGGSPREAGWRLYDHSSLVEHFRRRQRRPIVEAGPLTVGDRLPKRRLIGFVAGLDPAIADVVAGELLLSDRRLGQVGVAVGAAGVSGGKLPGQLVSLTRGQTRAHALQIGAHGVAHHGEVATHNDESLVATAGARSRILHLQHRHTLAGCQFRPVVGTAGPGHARADDDGVHPLGQARVRVAVPRVVGERVSPGQPDRRARDLPGEGDASQGLGDVAKHLAACPAEEPAHARRPAMPRIHGAHERPRGAQVVTAQAEQQAKGDAQARPGPADHTLTAAVVVGHQGLQVLASSAYSRACPAMSTPTSSDQAASSRR